jgi:hypothetical protein
MSNRAWMMSAAFLSHRKGWEAVQYCVDQIGSFLGRLEKWSEKQLCSRWTIKEISDIK